MNDYMQHLARMQEPMRQLGSGSKSRNLNPNVAQMERRAARAALVVAANVVAHEQEMAEKADDARVAAILRAFELKLERQEKRQEKSKAKCKAKSKRSVSKPSKTSLCLLPLVKSGEGRQALPDLKPGPATVVTRVGIIKPSIIKPDTIDVDSIESSSIESSSIEPSIIEVLESSITINVCMERNMNHDDYNDEQGMAVWAANFGLYARQQPTLATLLNPGPAAHMQADGSWADRPMSTNVVIMEGKAGESSFKLEPNRELPPVRVSGTLFF